MSEEHIKKTDVLNAIDDRIVCIKREIDHIKEEIYGMKDDDSVGCDCNNCEDIKKIRALDSLNNEITWFKAVELLQRQQLDSEEIDIEAEEKEDDIGFAF